MWPPELIVDVVLLSIMVEFCIIVTNVFVYQLYCNKNNIPKFSRIIAILFCVAECLVWISALELSISIFEILDHYEYHPSTIWLCTSAVIYVFAHFFMSPLTFYGFILYRLKIAFKGSAYEISNSYCICMFSVAIVSSLIVIMGLVRVVLDPDPESVITFLVICLIQYLIIDPMIRITVVYKFTKTLMVLLVSQTEEFASYMNVELRINHIKSDLNERQYKHLKLITKHVLLVIVMVVLNFLFLIWNTVRFLATDNGLIISSTIVCMTVDSLEVICLYLGFSFSDKLYYRLCNRTHTLFEKCCKKHAMKQINDYVDNSYQQLQSQASIQ